VQLIVQNTKNIGKTNLNIEKRDISRYEKSKNQIMFETAQEFLVKTYCELSDK
jgi:hypothetical protein